MSRWSGEVVRVAHLLGRLSRSPQYFPHRPVSTPWTRGQARGQGSGVRPGARSKDRGQGSGQGPGVRSQARGQE